MKHLLRVFLISGIVLIGSANAVLSLLPMKLTVQTGDTIECPVVTKDWIKTDNSVSITCTGSLNGTVSGIDKFYTYDSSFLKCDTSIPRNLPGIRYIPAASFTGRDSFTVKVSTSSGIIETQYKVMVTPPEPGAMTILLIVNSTLLPSVTTEVNRLKADLQDEGYIAKIKSFTPSTSQVANVAAKILWDSLVSEYDNPSQTVAGAILIGNMPMGASYRKSAASYIAMESHFWCMSMWLPSVDSDSSINGLRVGQGGYAKVAYTKSMANLWVSRISANVASLAPESILVKRILQNNHDYRKGLSRLPRTAYGANMRRIPELDYKKLQSIWPDFKVRNYKDSTSPLYKEFRIGGEVLDLHCEGNTTFLDASAVVHSITDNVLYRSNMALRFALISSCHTGGSNSIVNKFLYPKNGHCVLSIGCIDYTQNGQNSLADTTYHKFIMKMNKILSQGERFGRARIRTGAMNWGAVFHGDLSLKPNMTSANILPLISAVQATYKGGMAWDFTVNASDADGNITAYDWYPEGYANGNAIPNASSPTATTFSYTFAASKLCTLRVEAVDEWKGRDFYEVVIKTDSGVVKTLTPPTTTVENRECKTVSEYAMTVYPNPFNPICGVSITLLKSEHAKVSVINSRGQLVETIVNGTLGAGQHKQIWNPDAKHTAAGLYLIRMEVAGKTIERKAVLAR
ncbi:MAG: T9SS type A sorting domain-containing protein [Fibrobacteres bacterium]|nr:T9SS type A sorting domain-containing protein [Fibrobacterota bacterium]